MSDSSPASDADTGVDEAAADAEREQAKQETERARAKAEAQVQELRDQAHERR